MHNGNIVTLNPEQHAKFLKCYSEYPMVMQVLENILADRQLTTGIGRFFKSQEMAEIQVECMFLPVLQASDLIKVDSTTKCGYKATATDYRFAANALSRSQRVEVLASVVGNIAHSITDSDTPENVAMINISGFQESNKLNLFLKQVKTLAVEMLESPTDTRNGTRIAFALVSKIFSEEV